ncbi:MAG TPA: VTT domain-containing protein [Nocardioidaceae bacterium]|nr:VTT domain-containing protein [Nocardioidaceae bacterium]
MTELLPMLVNPWLLGIDWLDPEYLLNAMGDFAFWGLLFIIFAECGLFALLPGDSLLFVAGLFIAGGWEHSPGIAVACAAISVAAWLGNLSGYAIGHKVGPALFSKPDARLFKQEYVDKTYAFFDRYGNRAIVLARFVPIVRTFITMAAGVGRMSFTRFATYSAIGAVLWGTGITLLGYWLGSIQLIKDNIDLIAVGIVVVSVIPMVVEFMREKSRTRDPRYDEPEERARVEREDIRGEDD